MYWLSLIQYYLNANDAKKIKNKSAPNIAKKYYRLKDDATIRDGVHHVRRIDLYLNITIKNN